MGCSFHLSGYHSTISPRECTCAFETIRKWEKERKKRRLENLNINEMRMYSIWLPIRVEISVSQLLNTEIRFCTWKWPNSLCKKNMNRKTYTQKWIQTFRPTSKSTFSVFFFGTDSKKSCQKAKAKAISFTNPKTSQTKKDQKRQGSGVFVRQKKKKRTKVEDYISIRSWQKEKGKKNWWKDDWKELFSDIGIGEKNYFRNCVSDLDSIFFQSFHVL